MKFRVLSIDAWSDGEGWTWNNWFNFGEYNEEKYGPLTEANALKYFQDQLMRKSDIENYEVDDDQYNLVLVRKDEDRKPVLAIEYGNKY